MYFIFFKGNATQPSAKTALSGIFVLISPFFSFSGAPFFVYKITLLPRLISEDFAQAVTPLFTSLPILRSLLGRPFPTSTAHFCTSTELSPAMEKDATNAGDASQRHAYDLHGVG